MSFSLMNGGFYGFLCFCICFAYLTFTLPYEKKKPRTIWPSVHRLLKLFPCFLILVCSVNSSLVNRFQIIMVALVLFQRFSNTLLPLWECPLGAIMLIMGRAVSKQTSKFGCSKVALSFMCSTILYLRGAHFFKKKLSNWASRYIFPKKGLFIGVGVWGQEHWKSHVFQVFLNHIELDAHVFSYIL